ncbi:MAG: hypothetical protein L3J04_11625 [Robiginitomaculum sp.]|nr:hypothetical protein [Robiginitomaculum sp.]
MRVLKKAWEANPHPDIATAYASIAPEETPQERLTRFQPLLKLRADHPASARRASLFSMARLPFDPARYAGHVHYRICHAILPCFSAGLYVAL